MGNSQNFFIKTNHLDNVPQGNIGWKDVSWTLAFGTGNRFELIDKVISSQDRVLGAGEHDLDLQAYKTFDEFTLGGKTKVKFKDKNPEGKFVRWWLNDGENKIHLKFNEKFRNENDQYFDYIAPESPYPTSLIIEVTSYVTQPPQPEEENEVPSINTENEVPSINTENEVPSINTCKPKIMTQNNKIIITYPEFPTDEPSDGDDIVEGFSKKGEQICFDKSCLLLVIILLVVLWYSGKLNM